MSEKQCNPDQTPQTAASDQGYTVFTLIRVTLFAQACLAKYLG